MNAIKIKNRDSLGSEWILASNGYNRLQKCQKRIWIYQNELKSYAALFQNLGQCEIKAEDLYGIGQSLERISRNLERISDHLSKTTETK